MTMVEERALTTWRCPKCSRILAKVRLPLDAYVQIKCPCNNVAEKGDR